MQSIGVERIAEISSKTYSGCYGGETSNIADFVTVFLDCPNKPVSFEMKQIIFVVDVSGSMRDTMHFLKASLFAARNSLLKFLENTSSSETDRDQAFTDKCKCSLITFSNKAKCPWESNAVVQARGGRLHSASFSEAVNGLECDASTNIGDGILLAFNKKLENHSTWIIMLTDGVPNKGAYQVAQSFNNLMKMLPERTKIVPLGYTTDFDPDILSMLGTMTYLDSEESIPEVLGGIIGEIATCYGVDAKIVLPVLENEHVNPDDLIIVPNVISTSRDIIGDTYIGCLYNERKYIYAYLPWGNTMRLELSKYHNLNGTLSYYDIVSNDTVIVPFIIEKGESQIPDNIFEGYFSSSKARIILGIYQAKKNEKFGRQLIDSIKSKIEDWKHPCSASHKEDILRILSDSGSERKCRVFAAGMASSAKTQTSYTGPKYTTNAQKLASISTSVDYRNLYLNCSKDHTTIDPNYINKF